MALVNVVKPASRGGSASCLMDERPFVATVGPSATPEARERFEMARKAGPQGDRTAAVTRQAGLTPIARHGDEAMSLRQPASLRDDVETEQDLLPDLVRGRFVDLLGRNGPDPVERFEAAVANHVLDHLDTKAGVTVANLEPRSSEPGNLDAAMALRRSYEDRLIAVPDGEAATGALGLVEARVGAYASGDAHRGLRLVRPGRAAERGGHRPDP